MPKKGIAKECSNYHTITFILHTSKEMLKILQAKFQQYMNAELPDVQAGFRKGRGTRDQIANICWIMEKASEFQKSIYFCFIDYAKAFDSRLYYLGKFTKDRTLLFISSLQMPWTVSGIGKQSTSICKNE